MVHINVRNDGFHVAPSPTDPPWPMVSFHTGPYETFDEATEAQAEIERRLIAFWQDHSLDG